MKIIILIPYGAKTGGPEALHQLSDTIVTLGGDVEVWRVLPNDLQVIKSLHEQGLMKEGTVLGLGARMHHIPDYAVYRCRLPEHIQLTRDVCFVVPEIYVEWVKYFDSFKVVVWWLSVDNSFAFLSRINLNYLRRKECYHGYQSIYAKRFLDALGLMRSFPLSDYTPPNEVHADIPKTDIAISSGAKVIYDVDAIAESLRQHCGCAVHVIRDMSRDEVYALLDRSALYIDLGSFPGKDRMPREALLRNCCIFLVRAGAGAGGDFEVFPEYIFDVDAVGGVNSVAKRIILDYPGSWRFFAKARMAVEREKSIFEHEVSGMLERVSS